MDKLTQLIFEAEDLYNLLPFSCYNEHQLITPSRKYPTWRFEIGNQSGAARLGEVDADFASKDNCFTPEDAIESVINQMKLLLHSDGR
jgi:hypothetical protein